MVGPSGWRGRSLLVVVIFSEPVLLGIIKWVYHLGHELVRLRDVEHRACVLVSAAVVSGGEDREELAPSESLESVHDAFVCAQYILGFVIV